MQKIRSYIRAILLVTVTLVCFSLFIPSLLFKPFGLDNDKWRHKAWTLWGYLCCKITGIQLEVRGKPPKTPFILVSNHLSYTDTFILLSLCDGVLISKSDVRNWPVLGWMMYVMGIIFIDRTSRSDIFRVNEQIEESLRPNQGVIFFPESTTSDGAGVLPFKTGLLSFAADRDIGVHYASINYRTYDPEKSARDYVHWWGDMTFFGHLMELLGIKKIHATVTFGDEVILEADRKQLASELHSRVEKQYQELNKIWTTEDA